MQAKKQALLASQLRRKERAVAQSEEKEAFEASWILLHCIELEFHFTLLQLMKKKQEVEKQEQSEQRKIEREMRRYWLLQSDLVANLLSLLFFL